MVNGDMATGQGGITK